MISLIKLTENDKRVIIAFLIIIILVLILFGYIVLAIKRVMKRQGKAIDTFMYDMVDAKVVTTPRRFRKIARTRNHVLFFKQVRAPLLILLGASAIIAGYTLISNNRDLSVLWSYDQGFKSLFFKLDWASVEKATLLGIKTFIPENWPAIVRRPQLLYTSLSAWTSYITFPLIFIGIIWYLTAVQAFIARFLRIRKMSTDAFMKNLENINTPKII